MHNAAMIPKYKDNEWYYGFQGKCVVQLSKSHKPYTTLPLNVKYHKINSKQSENEQAKLEREREREREREIEREGEGQVK